MDNKEIAKMGYESASQHFISRYQMRDNVVLVYLAAIGAILGVAFGGTNMFKVLLAIPFLSLGCSFLIVHHNVMLGALLLFLSDEISSVFEKDKTNIPQFENSKSLKRQFGFALLLRTWSQLLILYLPSIFALIMNYSSLYSVNLGDLLIWWFSLLCLLCGAILVLLVHFKQRKLK